ncbi:MAG TPA: DEDD exonuclease domain-containing protein [Streptosporangiaceae bacterium]|jgi:DNA polymerase-3 subunit epsilon|nr:DEDD exonuclease domain-containing protein [Streptosporangiaceae bacterium]
MTRAPDTQGVVQGTIDEVLATESQTLVDVTFVVVDLETTGGSPTESAITEVGAVKVRAGERLGEFATLVDPGSPIPPYITVLTGITQQMVLAAPTIETVLPSFLEFARGCVLVAHNAPFDVGFLRAACAAQGYPWPAFSVVDTADLARRVLSRDEVADCRLATLARFFRSATRPCHRALADARATVDVLHGLIERLGSFDVHTLPELTTFAKTPSPEQQRKRHLADEMPNAPGVYLFEDARGEILYVGKSGDLRTRVRSYFTAAETRRRVREMIGIAERVRPIVCATGLEAEVRELRLIAEHKPRYNRRSRFPERALWLKLTTNEPFPRLSLVRECRADGAAYLGPFSSARQAEAARAALHEAVPLRQCTQRLTLRLIERGRAHSCMLSDIGRCSAPCEGRQPPTAYAEHVRLTQTIMAGDVRPVVAAARLRIDRLTAQLRYEDAAVHRDRLAAFIRVAARCQRLTALIRCGRLVAARPAFAGGWELSVVQHGRLVAAGTIPPGAHPQPYVDALVATAETVVAGSGPLPFQASAEEMDCVLRWLDSPGVRLVDIDQGWTCPISGAEGMREWIEFGRSVGAGWLGKEGYARDGAGKDGWKRRPSRPLR